MKIDVKDLGKYFNISSIRRNMGDFLYKKAQFLMLVIFIFVALYLVFIWYTQIFHSQWDEVRVNEYIKAKQSKSETVLNRENFQEVIEKANTRSAEFEKPLDNIEDIFRLNK